MDQEDQIEAALIGGPADGQRVRIATDRDGIPPAVYVVATHLPLTLGDALELSTPSFERHEYQRARPGVPSDPTWLYKHWSGEEARSDH